MNLYNNFLVILLFLIIVLIIKQFIESGYYNVLKSIIKKDNTYDIDQLKFQTQLTNIITDTQIKINKAAEKGYLEGFQNNSNNSNNSQDIIPSYLNKTDIIKLQLFYKTTCKYCAEFMPTWNKIINSLPNNIKYEEIDCDKDIKQINENQITSVPTIILLVNNEKKVYMGNRNYTGINTFLKNNGVNLNNKLEDFNNGYSNDPDPTIPLNPHCPAVSFDKQIDLNTDSYMYQIFNSDGQYGYAVGGNKSDKLLTPYMAAYSTVDSYLSSLPDDNDPTKNSYKNLNECAQLYADNIINFGLCDADQLNEILGYQTNVSNGYSKERANNTDYSSNTNIANAIKNVCNL